MASRSSTYLGYEASPSRGGLTMQPMAIWPTTLEHRLMEAILTSCERTTSSQSPSSAMKPPRRPHSP
eukprot:scaffold190043_cov30-Tisochrysis_lutea.AAC.1